MHQWCLGRHTKHRRDHALFLTEIGLLLPEAGHCAAEVVGKITFGYEFVSCIIQHYSTVHSIEFSGLLRKLSELQIASKPVKTCSNTLDNLGVRILYSLVKTVNLRLAQRSGLSIGDLTLSTFDVRSLTWDSSLALVRCLWFSAQRLEQRARVDDFIDIFESFCRRYSIMLSLSIST